MSESTVRGVFLYNKRPSKSSPLCVRNLIVLAEPFKVVNGKLGRDFAAHRVSIEL